MTLTHYQQLYDILVGAPLSEMPTLRYFMMLCSAISEGCACSKNERVDRVKTAFAALGTAATFEEKKYLLSLAKTSNLELRDNDNVIWRIDL